MNDHKDSMERMLKRLHDLDSEINDFIQAVKEVREMKESAGLLHDRLTGDAEEMENQRKELDKLISSSSSLIDATGEQTRGLIIELEEKSEALFHEVKTGMAQMQELQNMPHKIDNKLKKLEERLVLSLEEKHRHQKYFTWMVLIILMAFIFFAIIAFSLR